MTEKVKEERKAKENLSPTPPIRENTKKEEIIFSSPARARMPLESDFLPPVIDVHTPPPLWLFLLFSRIRVHYFDDAYTCEVWHVLEDEFQWIHPKTKLWIDPWPPYWREWRKNRSFFEKLRDPNRIPDARRFGNTRKADNWRGTRKEAMDDVLG